MQQETKLSPINAFDEEGNTFVKEPTIKSGAIELEDLDRDSSSVKYGYYGRVISFGWPVEYYINSLLREHPYEHAICIDAAGRNHSGSAVYITANDLNHILEQLPEAKDPGAKIEDREIELTLVTANTVDMKYETFSRSALRQMVKQLKEQYPGCIHFDDTNGSIFYKGPIDLIVDKPSDPIEIFHQLKKGKFDAHVKTVLMKGDQCQFYLMRSGCSITGTEQADFATLECVCGHFQERKEKEEGND